MIPSNNVKSIELCASRFESLAILALRSLIWKSRIENWKSKNRIENLLCSYPSRLKAVGEACGQHTNYWVVLVNSVLNGLSNGTSEIVLASTSLALTPGGKVMEHPVCIWNAASCAAASEKLSEAAAHDAAVPYTYNVRGYMRTLSANRRKKTNLGSIIAPAGCINC